MIEQDGSTELAPVGGMEPGFYALRKFMDLGKMSFFTLWGYPEREATKGMVQSHSQKLEERGGRFAQCITAATTGAQQTAMAPA